MVVLFCFHGPLTHNRLLALGLVLLLGFVSGRATSHLNRFNKVCAMEMSGKVFGALEFVMYLAFLAGHADKFTLSDFLILAPLDFGHCRRYIYGSWIGWTCSSKFKIGSVYT